MRGDVVLGMRGLILIAVTILSGCSAVQPSTPPQNSKAPPRVLEIPADLRASIEQSIDLGREVYFQDKAAATGTDVLLEKLGTLEDKGLGGYLTIREGGDDGKPVDSWVNIFFTAETPARIAYRVRVPTMPGKPPEYEAVSPPEDVPGPLMNLIRARQTALAAVQPRSQPMNPVSFPGEVIGEKGILVLLIAATKESNTAVLGKHYRVLVSEDGRTVKNLMPLSDGALELSTLDEKGGPSAALVVSHVVTDYPLETHVFASMLNEIPIFVTTRRGVWAVNRDTITLFELPDEN